MSGNVIARHEVVARHSRSNSQGDYKVYELNGDGTKHWLDMTSEQFIATGRRWEMAQIINAKEREIIIRLDQL